jgi:hypothetical protein
MYCKTTALTKIPISPTILAVVALSWFFEAASSLWVAVLGFLARFTEMMETGGRPQRKS